MKKLYCLLLLLLPVFSYATINFQAIEDYGTSPVDGSHMYIAQSAFSNTGWLVALINNNVSQNETSVSPLLFIPDAAQTWPTSLPLAWEEVYSASGTRLCRTRTPNGWLVTNKITCDSTTISSGANYYFDDPNHLWSLTGKK